MLNKEIKQWAEQYTLRNPEWVKKRRLEYLINEFTKKALKKIQLGEIEAPDWFKVLIRQYQGVLTNQMDKIQREIRLWTTSDPLVGVTDDMIIRAKEYPLERLVEVNNQGFACCIWHDDKNPSMYCKKNYAHCFSCGKTGDTIDVYMELYNCSFQEAVKALN